LRRLETVLRKQNNLPALRVTSWGVDMVRRIMILMIIILAGYIFYEEFVADSVEPIFKKYKENQLLFQPKIPKIAYE
jgi:hypothetical protein